MAVSRGVENCGELRRIAENCAASRSAPSVASVKFEASSTMIGFDQGSGARAAKKTAAASAIIGRDGGRERGGRERGGG